MSSRPCRRLGFLFVLPLLLAALPALADVTLPDHATWATWEAEGAEPSGAWQSVPDPTASGGQYLSGDPGATLQYRFQVARPTTLRLKPVWWRDGARESAHLFPYPLPVSIGAAVVEAFPDRVFVLAPAAGQIGCLDPATEQLTGVYTLGGYLTDMRGSPAANRLYVSDALNDRLLILDAATGKVVTEIRTRRQPWSLALVGNQLYIACRKGRCVQVADLASGRIVKTQRLDLEPISLEPDGSPVSRLVIRYQQDAVNAATLNNLPDDEQQYGAHPSRMALSLPGGRRLEAVPDKPIIRSTRGGKMTDIDLSSALTTAAPATPPAGLPDAAYVGAIVNYNGKQALLAAPRSGRILVYDLEKNAVAQTIEVSGWPADIAAYPKADKAYVADAAGNRVVVIDMKTLAVAGEIKTPEQPLCLDLAINYELQRPELLPAQPINTLFVTCLAGKAVVAIDLATDQPRGTIETDCQPRAARLMPPPASGWWPMLADDRIAFAMQPRLAIEPTPQTLDLATGQLVAAPQRAEMAPRRTSVRPRVAGADKPVDITGPLTARIGTTPIDLTTLCDPQLQPQRALTDLDDPGSITVSLDGGPQFDWRRGIWSRPDNNLFLVYDSDDYWRWNAPAFMLRPGTHTLTVTAHNPDTNLDAMQATTTADGAIDITARPEPASTQGRVPGYSYGGVFYDTETPQFTLTVTNATADGQPVVIDAVLTDYMGDARALPTINAVAPPRGSLEVPLTIADAPRGRSRLTLKLQTSQGDLVRDVYFVRLPKLEHPRLMFRAEDLPAIQKRMAQYPRLFARYADWLKRQTAKEGKWPERFLPPGLTAAEMRAAGPTPPPNTPAPDWGWRMYEPGWRMVAAQFAARYIPGADSATLDARLKPLVNAPSTDTWCEYHHHGPFFPGAAESLADMAPEGATASQPGRAALPLTAFMAKYKGNIDVMPFTLMSLEEPLSPADRAIVYELGVLQWNFERYFETHLGTRGGVWWQNPWSWCYCPTQGITLDFLYTKNFFGEDRLFDKPVFRGYLTFMEMADPITDRLPLLPARRRPSGEPWRWILTALSHHPLEKDEYGWDAWIAKMNGDLPQPEEQAVDDLMSLKGMPLAGPVCGAPHHFNTAVSVPVALALGWYNPADPTVKWEDLPPTTLFDVDGWATMRSGWDSDATELMFMSGVRDHTTRHQPNHLLLVKSGQFLMGTPSTWADDGNCVPAWGNTVVAGDQWLPRWQLNLHATRSVERAVIDRFTPVNWTYLARDRALFGYAPAEGGWGGGTDLHGHTETILKDEGHIIGYETRPEFDYVAGDAAGAWPVDELQSHTRQIVFLKPNVVVIYDRVKLGPDATTSKWLSAVGPELTINGSQFTVKTGEAQLAGQVLLPASAQLTELAARPPGFNWGKQKLLQISPGQDASEMSYLVVLTTGKVGAVQAATASLVEGTETVGVDVGFGGKQYAVSFQRQGPVGGAVTINSQVILLPQRINDTYAAWKSDPRYQSWTTERRYDFIIPPADRKP